MQRALVAMALTQAAALQLQKLKENSKFDPLFDEETGAPINAAARRMCVYQWRAGEAGSVRDLPFTEVVKATDCFSDLCKVPLRRTVLMQNPSPKQAAR